MKTKTKMKRVIISVNTSNNNYNFVCKCEKGNNTETHSIKPNKTNNLFDYEYSHEDHMQNVLMFGELIGKTKKLINKHKEVDVEEFFTKLKDYYLLVEKYIECGMKNILVTIREIIVLCYTFLICYFDYNYGEIAEKIMETYSRKNWDYNNASEFQLMHSGVYSFKTTIEHKILRIKSFYEGKEFQVEDEKIWDTICDLMTYCFIYAIWVCKDCPMERKINIEVT